MTATETDGVAIPTDLAFMQPVLRRGRSYLDREILPGDENEFRLARLLATAADQGLDGVIVFGAAHLPEDLVYYANYTPTTFHGVLVARPGHPPTLLAGKGGARDHPYIRTVSWVSDIRYAADIGKALVDITDEWKGGSGLLGVVGMDTSLPHGVRDGVVDALGDRIVAVDDLVQRERRRKSARELEVLRRARDLAAGAAGVAVEAAAAGAGRRAMLAAADHAARAGGAHDCRITAGTEDGGISTMSEVTGEPGPLSAVVAVEFLGYWGMAAIRAGLEPADGVGIERVVSALRSGVTVQAALTDAEAGTGAYLVNGIGCAIVEAPLGDDVDATLEDGDVVTVIRQHRGRCGLEFEVRTVRVASDGGCDL